MAQNAVILECNVCSKNEKADEVAKRALKQINDRDYASKAKEGLQEYYQIRSNI